MKYTKASGILSCMIFAATASSFTFAENNGWYLGGNVGQSKADIDEEKIADSILSTGFTNTLSDSDNKDTSYKLLAGYQFNRHFALEGGYFKLGEFNFTSNTLPAGTFTSNLEADGFNLDLVGIIPFNEKFSAFGRAGVTYAKTKDTFSSTGAAILLRTNASERDNNLKLGLGIEYAFNDNWSMRLEAERYRISHAVDHKSNIDVITLGLVYRFGSKPKPAPIVSTPPTPVVAPKPAPKFEKQILPAQVLFNFDSSTVNLPQPKLDEITTSAQYEGAPKQVSIVGYADRLGSDNYNQKLSEQRALAVKNYMVEKGIDANRLVTQGKGEADPLVQCNDKNKESLINCLAPNRRVEIDGVKNEELKSNSAQ